MTSYKIATIALLLMGLLAPPVIAETTDKHFKGKASWYGGELHGHRTASGVAFDKEKLTAAHRTLPFGTKVLVKNSRNGKCCIVEIKDRGPHIRGRVIDVSRSAAQALGIVSSGIGEVECQVLTADEAKKIAASIDNATNVNKLDVKQLLAIRRSPELFSKSSDEIDNDLNELLTPEVASDDLNKIFGVDEFASSKTLK